MSIDSRKITNAVRARKDAKRPTPGMIDTSKPLPANVTKASQTGPMPKLPTLPKIGNSDTRSFAQAIIEITKARKEYQEMGEGNRARNQKGIKDRKRVGKMFDIRELLLGGGVAGQKLFG